MKTSRSIFKVGVDIIKTCFSKGKEKTIFAYSWNEYDFRMLKQAFYSSLPLIVIGSLKPIEMKRKQFYTRNYKINQTIQVRMKNPQEYFIITASSEFSLATTLEILKQSVWWNPLGMFFIVNKSIGACRDSVSYLKLTWRYNILNAIFLCRTFNKITKLYTYNPYSQSAPSFWNVINSNEQEDNNWTLLQHYFMRSSDTNSSSFCKNLEFDRTKFLNGHVIKVGAYADYKSLPHDVDTLENFGGINDDIFQVVWDHLKAKPNFKLYSEIGYLDNEGAPMPILKDLNSKEIDQSISATFRRDYLEYQSYPYESSCFCILSPKKPLPLIRKFMIIFTFKVWMIYLIVYMSSITILMYVLKQRISSSIMELLRMIVHTSSLRQPNSTSSRIFFISFVTAILISNLFLQTRLSSMSIAGYSKTRINSMQDLRKSNLTVYSSLSSVDFWHLTRMDFSNRYETGKFSHCVKRLQSGERVACVQGCLSVKYMQLKSGRIHMSNCVKSSHHLVFVAREGWPLMAKFNSLLKRICEAGLITLFYQRETQRFYKDDSDKYQSLIITLKHIRFAFYFWVFGLLASACTFSLELVFCQMMRMVHLYLNSK